MAKTPKYTGVTQNDDGSWTYRLKIKLDGRTVDTRIKKDSQGSPFLTARSAYEAKKAHEARLRTSTEESTKKAPTATLRDVYEHYLVTDGRGKAPATLRKQESMWRNHVEPAFGDMDVNAITILDLEDFLRKIYNDHSYQYTEGFLKFFYLLFSFADKMEVLQPERYDRMFVNRNKRLSMPTKTQADAEEDKEPPVIFSNEELKIIERIFYAEDCNLTTAYALGIYAGLRISECFGLRWRDIDWATHTMKISRQMHYVDGEIRLSRVKTLKSCRTVIIPQTLYQELELQYSVQKSQKEKLGNAYRNTERVYDEETKEWLQGADFVNRKKTGELLTVNSMKYWAKKITAALNEHAENLATVQNLLHPNDIVPVKYKDFKYHYLRHTYASNCAAVNMNMQVLMDMMGHLKIDTTKKYYINTSNESLQDRTRRLLDSLYDRPDDGGGLSIDS